MEQAFSEVRGPTPHTVVVRLLISANQEVELLFDALTPHLWRVKAFRWESRFIVSYRPFDLILVQVFAFFEVGSLEVCSPGVGS